MSYEIYPILPLYSKETLYYLRTTKTKKVYITVIVACLLVFILLPFINISISVQGHGIIRPITEKTEIKAIQPEIVTSVFIKEGQSVSKGDTLILLRCDILNNKTRLLQNEINELELLIEDLNNLTGSQENNLLTGLYNSDYNSFLEKITEQDLKIEKARNELDRNRELYSYEMISKKVFEDLVFNYNQLTKERTILKTTRIAQWKAQLNEYMNEKDERLSQLKILSFQKLLYVITAPVSGTVEEFSGIYPGSTLQTGQTVAIISPDSEKIAAIYVSAKDIGYIKDGQTTQIQIDAFNYNQWGTITGYVIDISDDFVMADNKPVFYVKCSLSKEYMELKNGVRGNIKKGMTVNARFLIAKRSIMQLIYQKSDDWLNPSRSPAVESN